MRIGTIVLLLFAALSPARAAAPLVVHVTVALCDNDHQGVVPVPRAIGNGRDPRNNLYWGCDFGVKTWLLRHEKWRKVDVAPAGDPRILERLVASKVIAGRTVYIVADAWDGAEIRAAINGFLEGAAGLRRGEVRTADGVTLGTGGAADVVAYVGHDGLMDFGATARLTGGSGARPRSIVLACASRQYFEALLTAGRSEPLLLTTNLMAPEAYTLTAAIEAFVKGEEVREAAARAYDAHQHCGIRGARRLFYTPGGQ